MSEMIEQIDKGKIREKYDELHPKFQKLGKKIKEIIESGLKSEGKVNYFSINFRVKEFESLVKKIIKNKCFNNPFESIQDILGVRVITYFKSDMEIVLKFITKQFELIRSVDDKSQSLSLEAFGYQAIHCDVILNETRQKLPECNEYKELPAEIQICTINQHAWSEIFHEIGYKPKNPSVDLPDELKRRFICLNALIEMGDREFDSIRKDYEKFATKTKESDDLENLSAQIIDEIIQNKEVLFALLESFYDQKQFQIILDISEKALKKYPKNGSILNLNGIAFSGLKQHTKAIASFDKILEFHPNSEAVWFNKGGAFFDMERFQEALECINKSLDLNPKNPKAWSNKGAILTNLKRYEEALQATNKALELDPQLGHAYFNKACIASLKNNKEEALELLRIAFELESDSKEKARNEPDFDNIKETKEFKELVEE